MFAWVTSALREEEVDKALLLAGSLRRAKTAMKLVVLTAPTILSKAIRNKLTTAFDLVMNLDEEDEARYCSAGSLPMLLTFSLEIFEKCVYLSPNMMVVRNCDELFDKYNSLLSLCKCGDEWDENIGVIRPSADICKAFRESIKNTSTRIADVSKTAFYDEIINNNIANVGVLDDRYVVGITMTIDGKLNHQTGWLDACIVNFKQMHPLSFWNAGNDITIAATDATDINMPIAIARSIFEDDLHGGTTGNHLTPIMTRPPKALVNEPVAIVGLSFRFPGASNPQELWELLKLGKEAIKPVPQHRWGAQQIGSHWKNRDVQAGFLDAPIEEFDAKFFGSSRKDACAMDPQQRLLLEVSWEALEQAGIDPISLYGTQAGVFVGSWTQHYRDITMNAMNYDFFRCYITNSLAAASAKLSHLLGITGPSISTESGCSSSMVAVDMATKSLRRRDCSLALAAGVNLLISPFDCDRMTGVLSPDFKCKAFDAKANGLVRAEGVATLVLKRLSDAVRDEDNIWGLLKGTGVAQEGTSKSIGTPTSQGEALAMEMALKDGGVTPGEVSYIEAHGTGTPVGDPVEMAAIAKAYTCDGRVEPLMIASVKTNIGHTESVSGIAGIIKVLLALKHETIPPHINLECLNPEFNLDQIPAIIPREAMPWPRHPNNRRLAGVSSFGISGTNGHAIIEEAPIIPNNAKSRATHHFQPPLHILKLSAKSEESLEQLISKYSELLESCPEETTFGDICYSANTGRSTFTHRVFAVAKDGRTARKLLQEGSFKRGLVSEGSASTPLCFLFTGQGSQYQGMAATLYQTSPIFRFHFDQSSDILQSKYNISIKDVMWATSLLRPSSDELNRTLYSQTSIFVVEYCLFKLWDSWGVKPDFVMGHSLGEFAAAVAADALSLEDALKLVAERSQLIDGLPRGKMLVIREGQTTVEEYVKEYTTLHDSDFWVDYAALNSPDQTVLAGDSGMIQGFSEFCSEKGLKCSILASTHAFHSRHMYPILGLYRKVAETIKARGNGTGSGGKSPVFISSVEGRVIEAGSIDADYWVRHAREKVSFIEASKAAASLGCSLFLEVGPHPVLSALIGRVLEGSGRHISTLPSLRRNADEWSVLLGSLSTLCLSPWKGTIDWKGFYKGYNNFKRVPLPFYPFNRKPLWVELRPTLPEIHPLVGRAIDNCSNLLALYESGLASNSLGYLQDHVIGTTVVFPGAGFLEMALAAGYASLRSLKLELTKPSNPIAVRNLKILSPLSLQKVREGRVVLQTMVNLEDYDDQKSQGYLVKICRQSGSSSETAGWKWNAHATAHFHPVVSTDQNETRLDTKLMQTEWKEFDTSQLYEELPEVGLRFGPTFQSLECGWKREEGGGSLFKVKVPEGDQQGSYMVHPILLDAMLQAAMCGKSAEGGGNKRKRLHVPVLIGEFIYLRESQSQGRFIYCAEDKDGGDMCVTLVDSDGVPLATMTKMEFIETSAKMIEGLIQQQAVPMPKVLEQVFKSAPGPLQNALDMTGLHLNLGEELGPLLSQAGKVSPVEEAFYTNLCKMTRHSFLNALYMLGWKPQVELPFSADSVMESLSISKSYEKFIRWWFQSLRDKGILTGDPSGLFWFEQEPPTQLQTEAQLQVIITSPEEMSRADYRLVSEVGRQLPEILRGTLQPLSVLFANEPGKPNAAQFYAHASTLAESTTEQIGAAVVTAVKNSVCNSNPAGVFRVLEIGAGTGMFSRKFLKILHSMEQMPVEYFYTDVSPAFFVEAEKEFRGSFGDSLRFKSFNMEEDPFVQGLCPQYFDMIVACEVLHVAKNVKGTLARLQPLLKPGGLIKIIETTTPCPKITFTFGLLDGYWGFEDTDCRKDHITLSPAKWEESLASANFQNVQLVPAYMNVHSIIMAQKGGEMVKLKSKVEESTTDTNYTWILFDDGLPLARKLEAKLAQLNRTCVAFQKPSNLNASSEDCIKEKIRTLMESLTRSPSSNSKLEGILYLWPLSSCSNHQAEIALPFMTICQLVTCMEGPKAPKVFVITRGIYPTDGDLVENPHPGTLPGLLRSVGNEHAQINFSHLDLPTTDEPSDADGEEEGDANKIFYSLWGDNNRGHTSVFRGGSRLQPKFVTAKLPNEYLHLPHGCNRFQLMLPKSKLISDLEFTYLPDYSLDGDLVEIEVKAMALNFRDVFAVLKPSPVFEKMNAVGIDMAGVVSRVGPSVRNLKVGDRIAAMQMDESVALPSHLRMKECFTIPLPHDMTFCEGATLPTVFLTAYYCLLVVAKIRRGETLLVHTASGGVGLCVIQLAKHFGVEILATAGSSRKRKFLRNLGISHVFSSRNTDFGKQILEVTGGGGVDVVLNSLTGPGFKEATLDALGNSGRFVEMSKLNVWEPHEVEQLRPDVFYKIADFTLLQEADMRELYQAANEYVSKGLLKPIPYERFDALNIRGALNYMQKTKHIGKIVCVMPDLSRDGVGYYCQTPMFQESRTYVVTGGLRGIGLEVVKWILRSGGKHVLIASRSSPTPEMAAQIDSWNESGHHVTAFAVDVGDFLQVKRLLDGENLRNFGYPPVRGVMHAAGLLSDATIENQTWDKFYTTYNPKVDGSWNLHLLTKELPLEHFVLFSSFSACFGSTGQSNHSSSNSFEDALAHHRYSLGLAATSINWGNWGEVGVATEVDFPGIIPLSTSQGILALEVFLRTQRLHGAVLNVDSFSFLFKRCPQLKSLIDDKTLFREVEQGRTSVLNANEFWKKVDSCAEEEQRLVVFQGLVKDVIKNLLCCDASEQIEDNAEFVSIGVDSLMMIEMKNSLESVLGSRLTLSGTQLKHCNTPAQLAQRLVDIYQGGWSAEEASGGIRIPTHEELKQLVREDSMLPPHIQVDAKLPRKSISEVTIVLLTGVTGNLGPYLLQELCQRAEICTVFCLIRKSAKLSPEQRLEAALRATQLVVDLSKVKVVQGDIAKPNFGLPESEYNHLAAQVDCVIHSAVMADHTAKYFKADVDHSSSNANNVRSVNVFGTLRILEFCTCQRLKHLYHSSTVLTSLNVDGCATESWQKVDAFDKFDLNIGYLFTKHVCEQLIREAVERGLPCKAFRLPGIGGHSQTGRCDFRLNHTLLRYLAVLKLGCMPADSMPVSYIPADKCARLSLAVFFHEGADYDVYNVCQQSSDFEQRMFVPMAKEAFGIEIRLVSQAEFMEKVKNEGKASPLSNFEPLYSQKHLDSWCEFTSKSAFEKCNGNAGSFYRSTKISKLIPGFEAGLEQPGAYIHRDLSFLKENGVFEMFGIQCKP